MKKQTKLLIVFGAMLGGLGLTVDLKAADEESLDIVYVTSIIDKNFGTTPLFANDCNSAGSGTNCSIRQALRVVKSGGEVIIPAGDYCLKSTLGDLEITDKSLTITGAGVETGSATVIGYKPYDTDGDGIASSTYLTGCSDAANDSRVITINLKADTEGKSYEVKLNGLVIANGNMLNYGEGGGLYINANANGLSEAGEVLTAGTVNVTIANTLVTGNTAASDTTDAQGGGIYASASAVGYSSDDNSTARGGTATITIGEDVTVTGNTVAISDGFIHPAYGGGIYASASAFAKTSDAENNTAIGGTAVILISKNVTVSGNVASADRNSYGGGIYIDSDAYAHAFTSNSVVTAGTATVTISDDVIVSGNTASSSADSSSYSSYGGGISTSVSTSVRAGPSTENAVVTGGAVTITISDDVMVSGNTASSSADSSYGGGIYMIASTNTDDEGDSSTLAVGPITMTIREGVTVSGNTAANYGGGVAIHADKMELTITDSLIKDNTTTASDSYGAGLGIKFPASYGTSSLNVKLENSSILDNVSAGNGGGISSMIYSDSSDDSFLLEIVNSTISGNIATQNGGAIYLNDEDSDVDSTLSLSLKHSNILNNTSDLYGGGISSQYWNVTSFGSVIESNSGIGLANDCYISGDTGSFTSGGYNALRTTPSAEATCLLSFSDSSTLPVTSITTDITGDVDIGLAPLTIDSATGLSYYPLEEGSILQDAIPEGDCDSTVATDQVGTTRPQGSGCDIGSYEKPVTTGGGTSTSGSETSTSTTSDGGSSGEETTGTGSGGGSGGTGSAGETGTGSSGSESTAGSTTTGSSDTGGQGSENQGEGGGGCSFLITN